MGLENAQGELNGHVIDDVMLPYAVIVAT